MSRPRPSTIFPGGNQWSLLGARQTARRLPQESPRIPESPTLRLPRDASSSTGAASGVSAIGYSSPWVVYRKLFEVRFGNVPSVVVAEPRTTAAGGGGVVLVHALQTATTATREGTAAALIQEQVQALLRIRHAAFLEVHTIFCHAETFFAVLEFMPISLAELTGNPLLEDVHIACIVGQILQGLLYLERNDLAHGGLCCSSVLIDMTGTVKIWPYEGISGADGTSAPQALGLVAAELMRGYLDEDDPDTFADHTRWPPDSPAVDFVRAALAAKQASALAQHALLELPWDDTTSHLQGVVALAITWANRAYRFPAQ